MLIPRGGTRPQLSVMEALGPQKEIKSVLFPVLRPCPNRLGSVRDVPDWLGSVRDRPDWLSFVSSWCEIAVSVQVGAV